MPSTRLLASGAVQADVTTRLLLALALTLLLCEVLGRLAARARQPEVLGEIVAGLLCGPTCFGALLPGAQAWLFGPQVTALLQGIGQIAVGLFAFDVGLGLVSRRPERPLGSRGGVREVVPLAVLAALVPAAVGAGLGPVLAGRQLGGPHGGAGALAVFLATALGVTAVPVLARVLRDTGLERTRVGWLSLAAACLGDAFCWCLLAVALWLGGRVGSTALLLAVAGVAGAALAALLRARAGRRPGASRGAGRRSPMLLFAVVAVAAGASSWLGLHPLLGGIVAGVLWYGGRGGADTAVSSAEGQVSVLARLLLPCFFLSAGLRVDLRSVLDPGFAGLVLLLAGLTLAAKSVAAVALRRYYGLSGRETQRLAALLSTKGMTELVVLSVGLEAGLLSDRLYAALVAVALLLTLGVGPWLAVLAGRDRRDGRSVVAEGLPGEPSGELVDHGKPAGAGVGGLRLAAGDNSRIADEIENG